MVDNTSLMTLGRNIVDKVADNIIANAVIRPLGEEIGTIGASGDRTKTADTIAEETVRECLTDFLKTNTDIEVVLITEESGIVRLTDKKETGVFFILDPLDGSNNLRPWKTPSPYVSVSLAIGYTASLKNSKGFEAIEIGIVRDIFNNRTYYAEKGKGAFVTDFGAITSSPLEDIDKAIIGIDFDLQQEKYLEVASSVASLMKEKKCLRRLGSSILDLMKVASGEYETFLSLGARLKVHDVAAAQLIVREAGGIFDFIGSVHETLLEEIFESDDNSLIEKNKFKVIGSGNVFLHEKVLSLL